MFSLQMSIKRQLYNQAHNDSFKSSFVIKKNSEKKKSKHDA